MKDTTKEVEPEAIVDGYHPFCWRFLRPLAHVRQGYPEPGAATGSPEPPAIIFLNRLRELKARRNQRRQLLLEPCGEVLPEAAVINEMRLYFSVIKQVVFYRNRVFISSHTHANTLR